MRSHNQNEIVQYLIREEKKGRYKRCRHVEVMNIGGFNRPEYTIVCLKSSFDVQEVMRVYPDPDTRCPDDCYFFIDRQIAENLERAEQEKRERKENRAKQILQVKNLLVAPFLWFRDLSGLAQALILLIIFLLVARKVAPELVELVKALK